MSSGILGGNVQSIGVATVTVDLGSVAANQSEEETFTLPGARLGDFVIVAPSNHEAGIMTGPARVSANDTVTIVVMNTTAGGIDKAAAAMDVLWIRKDATQAAIRD